MATDTKDWPPKPRPEPPYPTPQADASLRAGEREMLDRILDADDDGDGHDMIRALRDARKLLGRVRQANMAPAQPSAVALSSIPAAEIEALRKVVTVELERDEWNHRVATHLRSFLARLQSPTPAGEGDGRPNGYAAAFNGKCGFVQLTRDSNCGRLLKRQRMESDGRHRF